MIKHKCQIKSSLSKIFCHLRALSVKSACIAWRENKISIHLTNPHISFLLNPFANFRKLLYKIWERVLAAIVKTYILSRSPSKSSFPQLLLSFSSSNTLKLFHWTSLTFSDLPVNPQKQLTLLLAVFHPHNLYKMSTQRRLRPVISFHQCRFVFVLSLPWKTQPLWSFLQCILIERKPKWAAFLLQDSSQLGVYST